MTEKYDYHVKIEYYSSGGSLVGSYHRETHSIGHPLTAEDYFKINAFDLCSITYPTIKIILKDKRTDKQTEYIRDLK